MNRKTRKIGILGGTFDPVHNAHLALADCAYRQLELTEVWFMPSANPPHKARRQITDAEDRLKMTDLAIGTHPGFKLSRFEIDRADGGYTYTSDTLEILLSRYPDTDFYFLIGSDSLFQIEDWHEPALVMERCILAAAPRDYPEMERSFSEQAAYLRRHYHARIEELDFQEIDISSTEIRALAAEGKPLSGLVPESVEAYIREHGLYGAS